ncbi:chorismate mutase, partial [Streptomyces lasiicapitis]|uniref:chorismate mutase n=1 Tax=Streptomyces lasiicapitis TaxID=1923961 RepID=UPI0036BD9685
MAVRAVRGAVQLDRDTADHMSERVRELLTTVLERNGLTADDLISIWFTATPDLHSDFPAAAARGLGHAHVTPKFAQEVDRQRGKPRGGREVAHLASVPT